MNDKIATLQDDLLAKDALLEKSYGKIERLNGKVLYLSVDLDDKKEKIKGWAARSGGFEREKAKLAVDLEVRDKELKVALEEIARMKRTGPGCARSEEGELAEVSRTDTQASCTEGEDGRGRPYP